MKDTGLRPEELNALFHIVSQTAATTGKEFLKGLLTEMVRHLNVQYAFIAVADSDDDQFLNFFLFWNGEAFVDLGKYEIAIAPCRNVVTGKMYHCPFDLQRKFPDDHDLVAIQAESYRGVPLISTKKRQFGHLGIIDTKPMEETVRISAVMNMFAARVTAEMERMESEKELKAINARLDRLHEEKNRFFRMAAHDLKNPLHNILGFASALSDDPVGFDDEEIAEIGGRIVCSGQKMLHSISEYLDVSKIEAGALDVSCTPLSLSETVATVIDDCRFAAESKGIKLLFRKPRFRYTVQADENYLPRIVENMVSNAIKFSPRGKQVVIDIVECAAGTSLIVADEGPGILPDDESRLFSKFTTLSAKPTGAEMSTGLGLYIAKNLADAMGITIECESNPGSGSIFRLHFPNVNLSVPAQ